MLLCGLCAVAGAQNLNDALTFSESNYIGSAYSAGLGNAVSALGGDLGTIGINPAGAVVAGYSQFTITPSLITTDSRTAFAPNHQQPFQGSDYRKKSSFNIPNIGYNVVMDMENPYSGLKTVSFGLVANTVNSYRSISNGHGTQGMTPNSSIFGQMAVAAMNANPSFTPEELTKYSDDYTNYWDCVMAYRTGLIGQLSGKPGEYIGCTEVVTSDGNIYVPNSLIQNINVVNTGCKTDLILNMAMDFNNNLLVGVNLGLPMGSYNSTRTITESADPMDNFPVSFAYNDGTVENTYFSSASYRYSYDSSYEGVYAKIGVIYLPFDGLRLAAALQTPTALTVEETWRHAGMVQYANGDRFSEESPACSYSYSISTPASLTLGAAYVLGKLGLVSMDYEAQNYNGIRFSEVDGLSNTHFNNLNSDIQNSFGVAHNLRFGAELNLNAFACVRCGYGFITSPEKVCLDAFSGDYKMSEDRLVHYSLGFGYKSHGAFFLDAAVKLSLLSDIIYTPYDDYDGIDAPDFRITRRMINSLVTLGWRF